LPTFAFSFLNFCVAVASSFTCYFFYGLNMWTTRCQQLYTKQPHKSQPPI
jgi:hypothetical protein